MVWASSRGTGHARTDTDHSGWPEAPTIVALGQPSRLVVYHRRHPLVVPLKTTPNSSGGSGMPLYRLLRENAFDQADVDRIVVVWGACVPCRTGWLRSVKGVGPWRRSRLRFPR
jgi:hypothetical protein